MQDFEHLDYYALLGVERIASADEIKRAYRQQIMRYHPDRFVTASPEEQEYARQRAQRINEAYAALSDFAARSAYNRGHAAPTVRTTPAATPPQPPVARDHQAELYAQATAHLEGERYLQAIALLRQLQQVNPFYRDSAALLAKAEAQGRSSRAPQPEAQPKASPRATPPAPSESSEQVAPSPTRRWLVGGILGSAAIALGAIAVGLRGRSPEPAATVGSVAEGIVPTSVLVAPSDVPTEIVVSTETKPTSVATTALLEATETSEPTVEPGVTPPPEDTSVPTVAIEQGTLITADSFTAPSGWASVQNQLWSVGYSRGAYRITVEPGAGNIWSYRTSPGGINYTIGVDATVDTGRAGLLLRYVDRANYLVYLVSPSQGSYRLELHSAGRTSILVEDTSSAIATGDGVSNRVAARLEDMTVTLYINGVQVAEETVPRLAQTRQYGVVAATSGGTTQALFNNLALHEL